MWQSQSIGSYEQAGEVSHMELQRGHEGLYRKGKPAAPLVMLRGKVRLP